MPTYPTSPRSAFLAWCQAHFNVFISNADHIGLTTAQANAFKAATVSAAASAGTQESARLAAEAATDNANDKFRVLRSSAAEMVRSIRTYAVNQNDTNVYVVAQIPPPVDPSQAPPPAKPSDLTVELDSGTGALTLRWKANNPTGTSGTSYIVRRRLSSTAPFVFVGVTGEKRYVDNDFFAGPDSVQYTVQGQRADRAGPNSDVFIINFGRSGPGITITGTSTAARMAA